MTRFHILGFDRIVELLLNAGADVTAKTSEGKTPKHVAAERGKIFDFK